MDDGVLLIGGGLDSVTVLVELCQRGYRPDLLHVDYGQKAAVKESQAIRYFANKYHVELHQMSIELSGIAEADILIGTPIGRMPTDNKLEGRNIILIGLAATLACTLGRRSVYVGYHKEPKEAPFPDATGATLTAMGEVLQTAYGTRLELSAPLWDKSRTEILRHARSIDKEIETKAWTCYENGGQDGVECGKCTHCIQKKQMQEELACVA